MSAVVNPRWQITLDRLARERLGVQPGMVAVQQVVGDQLIVTFIPARHNQSAAGVLGKPPRAVEDAWDAVREAAERAAAKEVDDRA